MKTRILLFFLFCSTHLLSQAYTDSTSLKLQEVVESESITGFGVAIIDKGAVVYLGGFGFADRSKKIPYTTKTVQPIASISKTLLGVSLLKAQELGLLNLDDDVNKYLPFKLVNPKYSDKIITIRHIATHSSSIKDSKHYEKSYIFQEKIPPIYKKLPIGVRRLALKKIIKLYNRNERIPQEDFLKNIYTKEGKWYRPKHFLSKAPGEQYEYSNNGAALASLIIEKASGKPYEQFVEEHILEPLEMNNSGWSWDNFDDAIKSKQYFAGYELPEYELITKADGGFITNIEDFSKYFKTIMEGFHSENNFLKTSSYDELLSKKTPPKNNSGIFWEIYDKQIGHSGGDPGVATFAFFDRDKARANIIFMNTTETKDLGIIIGQIFSILDEHYDRLVETSE